MTSIAKALDVLESVARGQGASLGEIAETVSLPKATAHRILGELARAGWVQRVEVDGRRVLWRTTFKLLTLSRLSGHLPDLRAAALRAMECVRAETLETIHLVVPEGRHCVLVERLDSPRALRIVRPLGGRLVLHASSSGKAILASYSEQHLEDYLRDPLEPVTSNTIVDADLLRAELRRIRKRGYATNDREMDEGVRAVGAAVVGPHGEAVAAISISGPADRVGKAMVPAFGRLVAQAAREVSASLT